MSDLPLEGRTVETKAVPLTTEERLDLLGQDVQELARGVNTQARLLEEIVMSFDTVVKKYLDLIRVPAEEPNAPKE